MMLETTAGILGITRVWVQGVASSGTGHPGNLIDPPCINVHKVQDIMYITYCRVQNCFDVLFGVNCKYINLLSNEKTL